MQQNQQNWPYYPIKKELKHGIVFFFLIVATIVSCKLLNPTLFFNIGFLPRILPGKDSGSKNECDFSDGNWIFDEDQPRVRYTENCPFLDPGFRCQENGRKDLDYQKWRWQPKDCDIPRFNAKDFLDRARNWRIVFAGDSIGRNQWESLTCMLAQGVANWTSIYEEYGNPITKHKGFLSIKFRDYNLTVQYYRVPYLVTIDRPPKNVSKEVYGAIRVDRLHWYSANWVGANVLVFSAGHWWNQDKTIKSYEGEHVNMSMDVMEAFKRSMNTLRVWAMQSLKPGKTQVFFRSYSPVYYREGAWDKGGYCNTSTQPETNRSKLDPDPPNNMIIREIARKLKNTISTTHFTNITYLTEFRKDGHPSSNREPGTPPDAPQDCSHWCLPGVPDTWNDLIYAELLRTGF
ncbi:trichome birefringence-like [Striga asiatica]|uniref:Trichome birefringence-like n=1 Tax=Striga asiatica TaxID=4170 RepID=A0A5A7PM00_STRAF|nr:trichome birefringence-like [Striga asiatica]